MTTPAAPAPKQQLQGERTPIRVELLLISHSNAHGVRMPHPSGGDKITHRVQTGIEGDIKTEIEFLPWMRRYRVSRFQREGANEAETWKPIKPFFVPETWAIHTEAE